MNNECLPDRLGISAMQVLLSERPAGGSNMEPFDRLIGEWSLEIIDIAPNGTETRLAGSWHFFFGLGGRAILDVWQVPGREHGLTVRFYDPSTDAWRSTWISPCGGIVMPFIGRRVNDEFVLEHDDRDKGIISRWIFFEVTNTTFRWRGEGSTDGGKSWRVEQMMLGKRIT